MQDFKMEIESIAMAYIDKRGIMRGYGKIHSRLGWHRVINKTREEICRIFDEAQAAEAMFYVFIQVNTEPEYETEGPSKASSLPRSNSSGDEECLRLT